VTHTTLPTIMTTLSGHQQLLDNTITSQVTQHYELNKKLKKQEKDIQKLYMILNTLHNYQATEQQMTPSDGRRRKKSKQRVSNSTFNIDSTSTSTLTNDFVTPITNNNQSESQLPTTIKKTQNDNKFKTTTLDLENTTMEQENDQLSVNLTQLPEHQLTPPQADNLQETSTFSHEYNSEDMIQLSQLSPINTSRTGNHTYSNTNNEFNHTDIINTTNQAIPLANDDSVSIQPRNLNDIYPNSRENSQSDNNNSLNTGNLETQGPGHNT
jgi:hypothetical protein